MKIRIHFKSAAQGEGYRNATIDDAFSKREISKKAHEVIDERWPWMRGIVQKIETLEVK